MMILAETDQMLAVHCRLSGVASLADFTRALMLA
jgi:hypothetical protein